MKRIEELDFLKGMFILLVIVFHLVYIGDTYPYAKRLVYTFHIPAFFMISGYLMKVDKKSLAFLKSMVWIMIPYIVMEAGYVVMSSVLPVRERVDVLSGTLLLDKIFVHPMGPYWYLHTLVVCGMAYFVVNRLKVYMEVYAMLLVLALVYALLSYGCGLIAAPSALYFMIGVVLSQSDVSFLSFFRASWLSLVPFVWLAAYPDNLNRFSIAGLLITYLSVSLFLAVFKVLPVRVRTVGCYIGEHSLLLLLFSPVFTMLVKPLVGILSFDPTGILFLFVALFIAVSGSLLIARIMDLLNISRFFFGKRKVLKPFIKQ